VAAVVARTVDQHSRVPRGHGRNADVLGWCKVASQVESSQVRVGQSKHRREKRGFGHAGDVAGGYLRTKESAAVNLGTTTGHAILGEHMWASDRAIRCRGYRPSRSGPRLQRQRRFSRVSVTICGLKIPCVHAGFEKRDQVCSNIRRRNV
jgi:hypothetical protein